MSARPSTSASRRGLRDVLAIGHKHHTIDALGALFGSLKLLPSKAIGVKPSFATLPRHNSSSDEESPGRFTAEEEELQRQVVCIEKIPIEDVPLDPRNLPALGEDFPVVRSADGRAYFTGTGCFKRDVLYQLATHYPDQRLDFGSTTIGVRNFKDATVIFLTRTNKVTVYKDKTTHYDMDHYAEKWMVPDDENEPVYLLFKGAPRFKDTMYKVAFEKGRPLHVMARNKGGEEPFWYLGRASVEHYDPKQDKTRAVIKMDDVNAAWYKANETRFP